MHTTLTARSVTTAGAVLATAALLLTGCSSAAKTVSATSAGSGAGGSSSAAPAASGSATTGGGVAPTGTASSGTPGNTPGSSGDTAPGGGSVVVVHNADKGHTVTLHTGQTLEVALDGGYWAAPTSSAAAVLRLSRQPSFSSPSPGRGCPPGVGCRTELTDFMAQTPGTATVSTSRSQCGEAMRCTDANSKFDVTVVVVA